MTSYLTPLLAKPISGLQNLCECGTQHSELNATHEWRCRTRNGIAST